MSDIARRIRQREMNDANEKAGEKELSRLTRHGCSVDWLSPYHARINDVVDFWPRSLKWRFARPPHSSGQGIEGLRCAVFAKAHPASGGSKRRVG